MDQLTDAEKREPEPQTPSDQDASSPPQETAEKPPRTEDGQAPGGQNGTNGAGGAAAPENAVNYSVSGGLSARLANLRVALIFTSYQSGRVYLVGQNAQRGINIHNSAVAKPMGVAVRGREGFVLASSAEIQCFENGLRADQRANEIFDACYVPRTIHYTGILDSHDVGLDPDGTPIFVNTRFNCLARPNRRHAFESIWRPNFVSRLVDEDRCHLNGLAMQDGKPAFVTAVSKSDTIDGWRDRRADGGILIDIASNAIVATGLSMPHSPRLHNGKLWVLNSGTGELGTVALDGKASGRFEPVAFCPGFVRGLAFVGQYAFVGLSKPRYKRFEGLELDSRLAEKDTEAWCGIQVIDCANGTCVDWFRIDGAVGEIYDVALLPGVRCPMALTARTREAAGFITFDDPDAPATLDV